VLDKISTKQQLNQVFHAKEDTKLDKYVFELSKIDQNY